VTRRLATPCGVCGTWDEHTPECQAEHARTYPPVKPSETRHLLHEPLPPCEQRCGAEATVYAVGPGAGDWGGRYCVPCAAKLGFTVTDFLRRSVEARRDR